jgi:hypothetical protein
MKHRFAWPIILLGSTVLVGVVVATGAQNTFRTFIAFAYLLICPGMAFVQLLDLPNYLMEWVLAVAASISIDLILSEIMVLTHLWSPTAAFFAVGLFCTAGALVQVIFLRQAHPKKQRNNL